MKPKLTLLLLFILFSTPFASTLYFPLVVNNKWTYQSKFLISTTYFSETIIDKQVVNNHEYFIFDDFRLGSSVYFRNDGAKVLTLIDGVEYMLYDFDADVGDRWTAPDPPSSIFGRMTLKSKSDTVHTPVGTFYGCYHFHHYIDAGNSYDEWIAPNMGIVIRNTMLMSGTFESKLYDFAIIPVNVAHTKNTMMDFQLFPAYPNPFNAETTICYSLTKNAHIQIKIYDMSGKKIATLIDSEQPPGTHRINWDATDQSSGVYILRINMDNNLFTRKLTVQK